MSDTRTGQQINRQAIRWMGGQRTAGREDKQRHEFIDRGTVRERGRYRERKRERERKKERIEEKVGSEKFLQKLNFDKSSWMV